MDHKYPKSGARPDPRNDPNKGRERAMSCPAALHYNQEIARFSKSKQYDLACASFERMLQAGVPPDVVTYNTMINVYVKSQRLSDAFMLFEEMKFHGINPTIITYTSLIDGCGKCNNFSHAMMLYEDVKSIGIELNMHFFNAILNAGLLNGNLYIIDTVLADVARYNFKPNTVTFNTLLAGFARFDQLRLMKGVVEKMIAQNVEFSLVTQTTLLQAAQLVRDQNDLRMFLDLLDAAKFTPSKNQASQAVMDLINSKQLLVAHSLLLTFINRNCPINEDVFTAMCRLAGEFGSFNVLESLKEIALSLDIDITNDLRLAFISILARFGDAKSALDIYQSWGESHYLVLIDIKLSLIDALLNANDNKNALIIVEHILIDKQTSEPQKCGQLLKLLMMRDMYNDVLRIHEQFKKEMIQIDSQGADCVITAMIRVENITESMIDSLCELKPSPAVLAAFARKLKTSNMIKRVVWTSLAKSSLVIPSQQDCVDILSSLVSNGMHEHAWSVFRHYAKCGVEACEQIVRCALLALSDSSDFEKLNFVYNYAREAEVAVPSDLASRLLLSAIDVGNAAVALAVKDEMVADGVKLSEAAEEAYHKISDICVFEESTLQTPQEEPMRPVRVRRRSSTCPRMHMNVDNDIYMQFLVDENDFI